jgi:hypothetical protein
MEKIIARVLAWWATYIEIDPRERIAARWLRAGARIILELLRNMLVAGALQYLAQKTKSPILYALALVAFGALFGYCAAFIFVWSIKLPFSITKNSTVYASVSASLQLLILSVSYGVILCGIFSAVNAVMKAQAS